MPRCNPLWKFVVLIPTFGGVVRSGTDSFDVTMGRRLKIMGLDARAAEQAAIRQTTRSTGRMEDKDKEKVKVVGGGRSEEEAGGDREGEQEGNREGEQTEEEQGGENGPYFYCWRCVPLVVQAQGKVAGGRLVYVMDRLRALIQIRAGRSIKSDGYWSDA